MEALNGRRNRLKIDLESIIVFLENFHFNFFPPFDK